jgi:hypothetical protein
VRYYVLLAALLVSAAACSQQGPYQAVVDGKGRVVIVDTRTGKTYIPEYTGQYASNPSSK